MTDQTGQTDQIYLVCGYKRTGKDTLVKMFNTRSEFKWLIYSNSLSNNLVIRNVTRVAFADKLREEVNKSLNIIEEFDYDTFKEIVVQDGKTYRDILIEHAAYRRNQDPDYWVKQINIVGESMITDWRYPNELLYLSKHCKAITIRLFRSEVPIPPSDVISEHQLDNTVTDFLLVPNEEDFEKACKIFPQYQNYHIC